MCNPCNCLNEHAARSYNIHELDVTKQPVDDIANWWSRYAFPPSDRQSTKYISLTRHMLSARLRRFPETLEEPPTPCHIHPATTREVQILPTILSSLQYSMISAGLVVKIPALVPYMSPKGVYQYRTEALKCHCSSRRRYARRHYPLRPGGKLHRDTSPIRARD